MQFSEPSTRFYSSRLAYCFASCYLLCHSVLNAYHSHPWITTTSPVTALLNQVACVVGAGRGGGEESERERESTTTCQTPRLQNISSRKRSRSYIFGQRSWVVLDPQLTFDDHVLKTTSSCMSSLAQISRVKHVLDRNQLVTVINALVFSKLLYCSTVWSNTSHKNICRLQSVQNFAAHIITGARKFDHNNPCTKRSTLVSN